MEQQKEKKIKNYGSSSSMSKPNSSIPLDLLSVILLKLPAKSFMRFRCVSKLWSSITTDRYFINSFETRSSRNPRLLLIFKNSNKMFVFSFPQNHPNDSSSDPLSQHVDRYQIKNTKYMSFTSMESVHGLICFQSRSRGKESGDTPTIWNPTMRQFLTLPKLESKRTTFFLGYDPIEGKHKVVCMPREGYYKECQVLTLGTSSSSSWRRIKTYLYHQPFPASHGNRQCCINGVFYYEAYQKFGQMKQSVLMSFDVRSEKFESIGMIPLDSIRDLLIAYEGRVTFVNLEYTNKGVGIIKLCVLEDSEKKQWSHTSFYVPFNSDDLSLIPRFRLSGVTDGGEFIFTSFLIRKSFCVLYFDPKRDKFRKVVFDGIVDDEFRLSNGLGDDPFKLLEAFPNHMENLLSLGAGVDVDDKSNPWAFDTTQFDNVLKKLKAVTNPLTRFYDDEEQEGDERESEEEDTVIETSLPAKRKHEEIIQEPKNFKLKNLCKQILKKDGGSMKLKQLKSLIDEQAPSLLSEFSSRKDAIAHLKIKLERSGKIVVEGKKISLVSKKK